MRATDQHEFACGASSTVSVAQRVQVGSVGGRAVSDDAAEQQPGVMGREELADLASEEY